MRAYRTVSTVAMEVIAGQYQIYLKLQLIIARHNIKTDLPFQIDGTVYVMQETEAEKIRFAERKLQEIWQRRWDADVRGRETSNPQYLGDYFDQKRSKLVNTKSTAPPLMVFILLFTYYAILRPSKFHFQILKTVEKGEFRTPCT